MLMFLFNLNNCLTEAYLRTSRMMLFVALVCHLQSSTNITKKQDCCTNTFFVTSFRSSYLKSDNWKYPKVSTLLQLRYSTFLSISVHIFAPFSNALTFSWTFVRIRDSMFSIKIDFAYTLTDWFMLNFYYSHFTEITVAYLW